MVQLTVLPALPPRVTSHMSGGRDLWSPPLSEAPPDPEIPISLVDLGLIYGISWTRDRVTIRVSYTATACPCMEFIREDVRDRLEREPWMPEVEILDVWDPPWTRDRITARGREQLLALGVGA